MINLMRSHGLIAMAGQTVTDEIRLIKLTTTYREKKLFSLKDPHTGRYLWNSKRFGG